ncbi:MAG: hypothetical protein M3Y80_08280 [Verrucomicrobiota bacterium]|nr:hypothetical protein [Verrucomicrobiota bacterium]
MTTDAATTPAATTPPLQVPMADVAQFVRQLSHDLRNNLNAAELQSAYVSEITEDAELKEELTRLRAMLSEMGANLASVTGLLVPVKLTEMPYEATAFAEDLQAKLTHRDPQQANAIQWSITTADAMLSIDPQILQQAMLELFTNAFQHARGAGAIEAAAEVRDGLFTFTLREPKSAFEGSTENWGREPFRKLKHGHYGLGLPRVRSIIEAHRGELHAHYDSASSSLVTTVSLPLYTS